MTYAGTAARAEEFLGSWIQSGIGVEVVKTDSAGCDAAVVAENTETAQVLVKTTEGYFELHTLDKSAGVDSYLRVLRLLEIKGNPFSGAEEVDNDYLLSQKAHVDAHIVQ